MTITIPIRIHCSVSETDYDDFVSWTSDFLGPARRSRLYTTEIAILDAIADEIAEIKASAPEIVALTFTYNVTRSRTPYPKEW